MKNFPTNKRRKPKEYNKHKIGNCVACGHDGQFYPLDVDHVKTVGSGGTNDPFNCMTLCRPCHTEKDSMGVNHMVRKYPCYQAWLVKNGWEKDEFSQKWRHYEA